MQLKICVSKNKNKFPPFSILFFLCHLVCCTVQKFACTMLKSDATIICYQQFSLWKLHAGYFLAITTVVYMPSMSIVSYHRQLHVVWYSISQIKVATFLSSMIHLTIVRCYLLQHYVLYAVLNSLARLLVHASTQNLCRFIHNMIYATCMVISTLIATQCLI